MTDVRYSTGADARPQSPDIGRRGFLRHLAVAPALAAGALPAACAPSAPSGLPGLIEAHRTAWAAMNHAADAMREAEAAQPQPPLVPGLGRAYELIIGRKEMLARIGEDYDRALHGLRAGVGRMLPEADLRRLVETVEQKRAENLAAAVRAFEEDDASPAAAAERVWQDASRAESAAFAVVLAFPCRTIEDVAEKAAYLLSTEWVQEDGLDEAEVLTLLRSATVAVTA